MRKYSTMLLLCGALIAGGCGREPVPGGDPTEPQPMRFGVSSLATRASVTTSVDDITSIGVFGYTTGADDGIPNDQGASVGGWNRPANLLDNQKVSRSGIDWIYNPQAYWPLDPTLNNTFFAYSPHSDEYAPDSYVQALVPGAGGPPTLRYTLPVNPADQKDILYARPVYNVRYGSDEARDGMVSYHMEHALTWFSFVLNPTDVAGVSGETYSVSGLSFRADDLPQASLLNLETGVWSTPITYGHVEWNMTIDPAAANNVPPSRPRRIVDEENRIMLLPFNLQARTTSIDLTYYYNSGGDSYDPATGEYLGSEYEYSLPIPATPLHAGRVVMYLINISPEGASVEFAGDNRIEDWISAGERGGGADDDGWIQMY